MMTTPPPFGLSGDAQLSYCCGWLACLTACTPFGFLFSLMAIKYARFADIEISQNETRLYGREMAWRGRMMGYGVLFFILLVSLTIALMILLLDLPVGQP